MSTKKSNYFNDAFESKRMVHEYFGANERLIFDKRSKALRDKNKIAFSPLVLRVCVLQINCLSRNFDKGKRKSRKICNYKFASVV